DGSPFCGGVGRRKPISGQTPRTPEPLWQEAGVPLSSKGERMIEHRVRMAISLALAVMIGACQGPEQAREGAASQSSDSGEGAEAAPIRAGAPADAIRAYYAAIDA